MSTFSVRISKCIDDALAPFRRELQSLGFIREHVQHNSFTLGDQHSSHTNTNKSHNFNTEPKPPYFLLHLLRTPPTPFLQEIQPVQHVGKHHLSLQNQYFHKSLITPPNVALPPPVSPAKLPAHSPPLAVRPMGTGHRSSLVVSFPNSTCAFIGASCWCSIVTQ